MIEVTDHAIVRYLERVLELDIDGVRQVIVRSLDSRGARRLVDFGGGTRCRITVDGIVFCLRGQTVTTCLGTHRERRTRRRTAELGYAAGNRRPQRRPRSRIPHVRQEPAGSRKERIATQL